MKSKIVIAYCTFPSKDVAESICRQLVSDGTIACANVFQPHTAIYAWNGAIQAEAECAAILKLNARKQTTLKEKIRATHPYAVPALVFLTVNDGLPEFVNWVYAQRPYAPF